MEDNSIFFTQPVDSTQKGVRLDKFLASVVPDMSRSMIQRLIAEGNVSVDDDDLSLDNAFKVRMGDVYQVYIPDAVEAEPKPENILLNVVFEDDDLIVINKPAGVVVHPAAGAYQGTLVNALLYHCKGSLSGIGGVKRPGIVHRIDKDTSGLLVAAKNDNAHKGLSEQFSKHSVERTYFAVVYGNPNPVLGRIETNIGRSKYDRKKMAVLASGGKTAITNYKVLENYKNEASLVQCNLETGRTHQIRVHMASIGCNLIGDQVYVKAKKSIFFKNDDFIKHFSRQALHAKSLGFIHPRSEKNMSFDSDLPEDMLELLQTLRLKV